MTAHPDISAHPGTLHLPSFDEIDGERLLHAHGSFTTSFFCLGNADLHSAKEHGALIEHLNHTKYENSWSAPLMLLLLFAFEHTSATKSH